MKDFFRTVLFYIKPYKLNAALNILLNLLSSIFSLFSLVLLIPFLGVLFEQQELVLTKPEFEFSTKILLDYFYYYMSVIIVENTKIKALVFVSAFILTMILFKNLFGYFANF